MDFGKIGILGVVLIILGIVVVIVGLTLLTDLFVTKAIKKKKGNQPAEEAEETATEEEAGEEAEEAATEEGEPESEEDARFAFVEAKKESVSFSFQAKIALADPEIQGYYCDLVNYALAYKKVRRRNSWGAEKFFYGKTLLFVLKMNGKTLRAQFALDPKDYEGKKMPIKDMSAKKSYAAVPLMLKIKSGLSVRRGKELIDDLATKNEIVKLEEKAVISVADFEGKTEEMLEQEGKIKRR